MEKRVEKARGGAGRTAPSLLLSILDREIYLKGRYLRKHPPEGVLSHYRPAPPLLDIAMKPPPTSKLAIVEKSNIQ